MPQKSRKKPLLVSFIIIVRDGSKSLPLLLNDYIKQDYPEELRELVIVEGGSRDNSRQIISHFVYENSLLNISVLNNPKKILASGWNVALHEAKGEIIIRVDAHSRIPPDFIRRNIERIKFGEIICGGYRQSLEPKGFWPRLAFLADSSRFGGSLASYRNPGAARYVDTLANAAYKWEIFATVGGYDERLVRNQDLEIHYRMHKAGFRFYYDPQIHSKYICRSSLRKLISQKLSDGFWIGIILGISPFCIRLRHLVPGAFILGILMTLLFWLVNVNTDWAPLPLLLLLLTYFFLAIYFAIRACKNEKGWNKIMYFLLPHVFCGLHLAYGAGTILGVFSMPFYLLFQYREYERKWLIDFIGK